MPHQIQVTEPHPSIASRLSKKFSSSTKSSNSSSDTVRLPSARGGVGNIATYHRSQLTSGLPEDTTFTQPAAHPVAARKSVDSDAASHRSSFSTTSSGSSSSSASSNASRHENDAAVQASSKPRMMFRGIGGAGNARSMAERRMFSFDEELEREEKLRSNMQKSKVVMVGRGGAGNVVR